MSKRTEPTLTILARFRSVAVRRLRDVGLISGALIALVQGTAATLRMFGARHLNLTPIHSTSAASATELHRGSLPDHAAQVRQMWD